MTKCGADWQVHAYGKTLHAFTNSAANDPELGTIYSPTAEKRSLQAMENFFSEVYQA
jgi:dienelactone hydrolase